MIQIQFLDKNVVNALVPAFSVQAEKIIFLYDRRCVNDRICNHMKKAIMNRMPGTKVYFETANMLRLDEIISKLKSMIETYKNQEIWVDITGGTELMTATGLLLAREYHLVPTYTDFYAGKVYHVFTYQKLKDVVNLSLEDYMTAVGGQIVSNSRRAPKKKDFKKIIDVAEYIFGHMNVWKDFFKHMVTGYSSTGVMEFALEELQFNTECKKLMDLFLEKGFAKKIGKDRYSFGSEENKEFLTVYGNWLEKYMYIKALDYYDDVYLGVEIDWNESDHIDLKDNEIDVLAMKGSQPFFISCKMAAVRKEAVYEVNALAKRLGGEYAKSLIATTERLSREKDEENGMYQRFEKIKVGLIEVQDFQTKDTATVFNQALQKIQ